MTASKQNLTPDEQVYQSNKQEPEVKVVYSNEPDDTTSGGDSSEGNVAPGAATADEVSAESFPASDAPANAAPGKPKHA